MTTQPEPDDDSDFYPEQWKPRERRDLDTASAPIQSREVEKFIASWHELQETVATALQSSPEIAR